MDQPYLVRGNRPVGDQHSGAACDFGMRAQRGTPIGELLMKGSGDGGGSEGMAGGGRAVG